LAGIDLDCKLLCRRAPQRQPVNQPKQMFLRKGTWTSTADVKALYALAQFISLDLSNHRVDNSTYIVFNNGLGVEAAVATLGPAKWNVNI
jgi:hypothetical protein